MAQVREVGGGASGHIHLIASDGTVWDSGPSDHLNYLAAQPSGPILAQQQGAAAAIALDIATAFNCQLDASALLLTFDWSSGAVTGVMIE